MRWRWASFSLRNSIGASGDKVVLQKQSLNSGSQECLDRFARRVDDRLALYVESRIQDHFTAGCFSDRLQKSVEIRIVFCRHGLDASAAVHMSDGRKRRPVLLADIDDHDHVRQFSASLDLEPDMSLFGGDRRCKWTKCL